MSLYIGWTRDANDRSGDPFYLHAILEQHALGLKVCGPGAAVAGAAGVFFQLERDVVA